MVYKVGNMAYAVYGQTLNNGRFLGVFGREEQPFYTAFLGLYRHADNSARENKRASERNLSDKGTARQIIGYYIVYRKNGGDYREVVQRAAFAYIRRSKIYREALTADGDSDTR